MRTPCESVTLTQAEDITRRKAASMRGRGAGKFSLLSMSDGIRTIALEHKLVVYLAKKNLTNVLELKRAFKFDEHKAMDLWLQSV
jgi:hypothetical protein